MQLVTDATKEVSVLPHMYCAHGYFLTTRGLFYWQRLAKPVLCLGMNK